MAWWRRLESGARAGGPGSSDLDHDAAQPTDFVSAIDVDSQLRLATDSGNLELVHALLRPHQMDSASKDDVHAKVLRWACSNGNARVADLVLQYGADPDMPLDQDGWTLLLDATRAGDIEIARVLLRAGANVDTQDDDGWTPVRFAAFGSNVEMVQLLLGYQAGVNMRDNDGWTPLMGATSAGCFEIVRLLRDAGANVDASDDNGYTPLHAAAEQDHVEILALLLASDADCEAKDLDGRTALHRVRSTDTAKLLLDAGASISAVDEAGWSPLHVACSEMRVDVARVLLEAGSAVDAATTDGYQGLCVVLFAAWRRGCDENTLKTLQLLVTWGSKWVPRCNEIVDQATSWPQSMEGRADDSSNARWSVEAPAIRLCFQRWSQEREEGLPPSYIPIEQVRLGVHATEVFIREVYASQEVVFRRKICVVGPSCWGKTSLIKSLTNNAPSLVHIDDRTIGIDHFRYYFDEDVPALGVTKKHEVTFWDFAGQDAYQPAHSLFFSARTLFLVCIDLQAYSIARMQADLMTEVESASTKWLNDFIDTKVLRWIRLVCARQRDAEFVFVATKKDQVRDDDSDGVLADLTERLQNVKILIDAMKSELDKSRSTSSKSPHDESVILPITHLGDARLSRMAKKPVVNLMVTSSISTQSVEYLKRCIQHTIVTSNRGFPMPEKFGLVLAAVTKMKIDAANLAVDKRLRRIFVSVDELIAVLVNQIAKLPRSTRSLPRLEPSQDASESESDYFSAEEFDSSSTSGSEDDRDNLSYRKSADDDDADEEEPYLDTSTCRTILETLRDLGDVLWYDTIGDDRLRDTIILDPMLMIDLVREVFNHKDSAEVMTHHTLKGLNFWRNLDETEGMLSMKRVLQHFHLVYPTTGEMAIDSDLIVPAFWKSNTSAFWLFGGGDLRFGRGTHEENVAIRVHWEFQFVNNYPDTLFDQLVVASYTPFFPRDVGPDWIMYKDEEVFACRLMLGRDHHTHHPTLHLEALQAHSANPDQADYLWMCFIILATSLDRQIRSYPGVKVTRFARQDQAHDKQARFTLETLARFDLPFSSRQWMPPKAVWETYLHSYAKAQEGRW